MITRKLINTKLKSEIITLIFPSVISALLLIYSQYNALAFHTFIELATVLISFIVFILGWLTYNSSENRFLIFLSCGYFWVGILDLYHAFLFPGVNIFVQSSSNTTIQFWMIARSLEALILLIAPFVFNRKINKYIIFFIISLISIVSIHLVFRNQFPLFFIDGKGLTPQKIYGEYLIVIILLSSIVSIVRHNKYMDKDEIIFVVIAITFTIMGEISFTLYDSLKATRYGVAGHILKLYSFWFIFRAVVITNIKKPYIRVKFAEEKLSRHITNTPLGYILWDRDFICREWNKSAENIFGYTAEEAIGKHPVETILLEESLEDIKKVFNLLLEQKGGTNNVNENTTKSGRTILCSWYNTPIPDESGNIVGIASLVNDITEQTEMEKNLRQSQKMDAIGQLSGGIAHDFNNMLGVIMGNISLLELKLKEQPEFSKYLKNAQQSVERSVKLTKKLLSFSRNEFGEPRKTNVNEFIFGMKALIEKSLTPKVSIVTHLADDIWTTYIDPNDFEDSLLNLSLNARDAMEHGGILTIETSNKVLDSEYVHLNPGSYSGDYVLISVSDNGTGMSNEIIEQIFIPFFSTKSKGTGLGMSMVYSFVKRSNGHIKVYSEENKGTTFHIFLPRLNSEVESDDRSLNIEYKELPCGKETILVVDDEEQLLSVAVAFLEKLGYKTISATQSSEALRILESNSEIDMVFSDVVMPGNMDGFSLGITILSKYPQKKILLTSGFTANHHKAQNGNKPLMDKLSRNILNKPYNISELARAIRKTLDNTI